MQVMFFDEPLGDCPWYYFDSSYKVLLGSCLVVFGVFGVLLNGWLFVTFIHSHLLTHRSYILVLNLCSASLGRNLLGFPFSGSSAIAKRWLFGSECCQLFAFMNLFLGVFQLYALLALVLERYLVAKYYRQEKILLSAVYWVLTCTPWVIALVFAVPPLFGYGMYSCDSTGTICTFQWPALDSGPKQLGYSVPYVGVCGVLPVIAIFFFMGRAIRLEQIYYRSVLKKEQKRLTKGFSDADWAGDTTDRKSVSGAAIFHQGNLVSWMSRKQSTVALSTAEAEYVAAALTSIHALTVTTLALWIPAAVLVGFQWLPLLLYGYRPHVPPTLSLVAPIASEAATCVPVLCYLASDERLRAALIGRMKKQYALLHPDLARRYNQP